MNLPIRIKFIAILVIAAVLPLCIALLVVETLGYRYYLRSQGSLFMVRAENLADELDLAIGAEAEKLNGWMALSGLLHDLPKYQSAGCPKQVDRDWSKTALGDPPLKDLLGNSAAHRLRAFQSMNPLFAEMFISGTDGLVLAATQKTSDYIQSDEEWWQTGMGLRLHQMAMEGIHFDQSAKVYSLDLIVPLIDPNGPSGVPIGVLKAVINASPLFAAARHDGVYEDTIRKVVFEDGSVLTDLSGRKIPEENLHGAPLPLGKDKAQSEGWLLTKSQADGKRILVGFAPLTFSGKVQDKLRTIGTIPMFVVVYKDAESILEPVQKNLLLVGSLGTALILGFTLAGYYIATTKIIDPMRRIQVVAKRIAGEIQAEDVSVLERRLPELALLRTVRTRDEIEALARDFESMATKVLTYHEQLESEIARKTAELESDLRMAREFQEALMPRSYPQIPGEGQRDAVDLHFEHVYRPASSVGGDFFDVLKLSEHKAGIFIADVMGHGARSALVTAILRALLQNLLDASKDPAAFLSHLNQLFYDIVRSSGETIFVSAFYLVIDTEAGLASFASAGHPPPLLANRRTKSVDFLLENGKAGPALGIFPFSEYQTLERRVQPGEIFLLFTDGVHEAYNAKDEEFGMERLQGAVKEYLRADSVTLASRVVQAVYDFIAPQTPADDFCIVTVEVQRPSRARPASEQSTATKHS